MTDLVSAALVWGCRWPQSVSAAEFRFTPGKQALADQLILILMR